MGRRGGVFLIIGYIKENIPTYEVQLLKEADYREAIKHDIQHLPLE